MELDYVEKLIQARARALKINDYGDGSHLDELAYDSLTIADLVIKISKHYKLDLMELSPEEWVTVGHVKLYVKQALTRKNTK